MSKYRKLSFYKLIMTEVSRNLRNIFLAKIPPIWKLKLDFCPLKKSFQIFWSNIMNNLHINYLWPKFQEICGIFFLGKIPPILNFKLDFCPLNKSFEIFWPNIMNNLFINYLWPKFQEVCGIFFLAKIPPILKLEVGFLSEKKSFFKIHEKGKK